MNMNRGFYCLLIISAAIGVCSFCLAAVPPDIVIFMTDQQNFTAMSCTGTPGISTPTMDGLAKEGVRFSHAFCATPQCSPARAAFWTGRYPHRTGVMGNTHRIEDLPAGQSPPLDPNIPNMGQVFSAAGYETVYLGKWHLGSHPSKFGFQEVDTKNVRGRSLSERAIDYLRQRSRRRGRHRPLLMIVSYINPHDIYYLKREPRVKIRPAIRLPVNLADDLSTKPLPQRQYRDRDQAKEQNGYTGQDWRRYISYYYQLTESVDAQIGLVLKEFRRHCHNSLVVFVSDHGDLAGAHGVGFKGPMMYEELVRVPLIISWPDRIAPAVCSELVS
ncbi:MAG: sulfatase family protein, partial [Planctomycetota bacterium]